ncbi:hypothetical protein GCM10023081_01590 [Arthrobacter ginkgonis]|uniref:Uncharacterized protein n=1 Tax=Arthrobacter ginkgonis TaxID=1630594 RepID=A0ABP7BP51_9MICC
MVRRQKKRNLDAALERSFAEQVPVDVWHEADGEPMGAAVLGLGRKWVLFALLVDGVLPNGHRVVRRRTIRRAKVSPLMNAHLRDLGVVPLPVPEPAINLGRTRDVLDSVSAGHRAFSVHRDEISPNTYLMGSPIEWCRRSFWFLTVDPKARWERTMTRIRLRDVTQVAFGSAYETAILATAGPLPERSNPS